MRLASKIPKKHFTPDQRRGINSWALIIDKMISLNAAADSQRVSGLGKLQNQPTTAL
jgi:hypothetical protein